MMAAQEDAYTPYPHDSDNKWDTRKAKCSFFLVCESPILFKRFDPMLIPHQV